MRYILHNLGLGDHIILNGLLRYYQKKFDKITVFCHAHNLDSVQYMFRDDENINAVAPYPQDHSRDDLSLGWDLAEKYIAENKLEDITLRVGPNQLTHNDMSDAHHQRFDEEFYSANSLPWETRFTYFKFQRDKAKELQVYNKLNPAYEEYIFHDNVDLSKVRQDLKIIKNPLEYSIFDLLTLIENAAEVHLMESSIKCLVNSYKFTKPKFFYHQYVRGYGEYLNTQGLNTFTTIH